MPPLRFDFPVEVCPFTTTKSAFVTHSGWGSGAIGSPRVSSDIGVMLPTTGSAAGVILTTVGVVDLGVDLAWGGALSPVLTAATAVFVILTSAGVVDLGTDLAWGG